MIEAIESNLFAYPIFHRRARTESHDGPELLWAISDIPAPLFNSIGRANLAGDEADVTIESLIARARAKRVSLLWWTSPSTRPLDLGERLEAHGFKRVGELPAMVLEEEGQAGLPVLHLEIELVRDLGMLKTWNGVFEGSDARFELYAAHLDSFRHFVGFVDGRAVATASLFFGGGTAGLYNLYTVPDARGRGYGAALTEAAIRAARDEGPMPIILQATPLSPPLYRRLGFVEHCTIGHYVFTPD